MSLNIQIWSVVLYYAALIILAKPSPYILKPGVIGVETLQIIYWTKKQVQNVCILCRSNTNKNTNTHTHKHTHTHTKVQARTRRACTSRLLLECFKSQLLYYPRTDHHWSPEGKSTQISYQIWYSTFCVAVFDNINVLLHCWTCYWGSWATLCWTELMLIL